MVADGLEEDDDHGVTPGKDDLTLLDSGRRRLFLVDRGPHAECAGRAHSCTQRAGYSTPYTVNHYSGTNTHEATRYQARPHVLLCHRPC
jgi:hypothetical protein